MKALFLFLTVGFLSTSAFAQRDSVGVFLRTDKVIVLTKELSVNRLSKAMDAFLAEDYMLLDASDKGLKMVCRRHLNQAACTFTFYPNKDVVIEEKLVQAQFAAADLGIANPLDFEIAFESSRQDKFTFSSKDGLITFQANKR